MKSGVYLSRIKKLQALLGDWEVDGCLVEHPLDLFFLTGLQLSAGVCLVLHKKTQLFVDGRYIEFAKKHSPIPAQLMTSLSLKGVERLAVDSQLTTVDRWNQLKKYVDELKPVSRLLKELRAVKDSHELKALEKSAKLLWRGFQFLQRLLKVGIEERELALAFEIFCRKEGAERLAFDPIIAFGKNTAYPHYRAGKAKLKRGDIILCDLGVVVDHYHSDMTRTFFYGKADPRLVLMDTVVKNAHAAALQHCRSGSSVGELDQAARRVIQQAGLEKLIAHSLGHGIGLEVHEFPRLKFQGEDHSVILQEGMAITIEPGLYMEGVGGVRHEDTVIVTRKGFKNLYD